MSVSVITRLTNEVYIPDDQKNKDHPLSFTVNPLNGIQHAEILNELRFNDGDFALTFKGVSLAVKYGVVGWENLFDESGEPIKYDPSKIKYVPGRYWHNLATFILRKSRITEEDEKKPG